MEAQKQSQKNHAKNYNSPRKTHLQKKLHNQAQKIFL